MSKQSNWGDIRIVFVKNGAIVTVDSLHLDLDKGAGSFVAKDKKEILRIIGRRIDEYLEKDGKGIVGKVDK